MAGRTEGREVRSGGRSDRGGRGGPGGGDRKPGMKRGPRRTFGKRKVCRFCSDKVTMISFTEYEALKRFLTEKGKIIPRRTTGACAKHQRMLARAIKRARHAGVLAFQAA